MPVMGSPAVSCSIKVWMASMTWGTLFLSRAARRPRGAPARFDVAGEQLAAAPGHGAGVDAQQLGDLGVSAVADLERLQPGIQPPLAFVEQAVEQHDGRLELVGQDPQPRAEGQAAGLGVIDRAGRQLGTAGRGLGERYT